MGPIIALFNLTIRQTLWQRKIWLTALMLVFPSALHLLIRSVAPPVDNARELWEMYHVSAHFLVISMLVPLVCMVHGAGLIGAEVEAGTMVYLVSRRLGRVTVLLVKFVATGLVLAVLCDLALVSVHVFALGWRGASTLIAGSSYADWSPMDDLGRYLMVIPLAVLGFLAVFNLIGLLAARPIAASVGYLVVVELILSNIPVRARIYSLSHYLRVTMAGMMPRVTDLYELPRELLQELYPAGATAVPEVLGIVLVALAAAAVLISVRELTSAKVARE